MPQSSRRRESNPRYRYGGPVCRHNTSPAWRCVAAVERGAHLNDHHARSAYASRVSNRIVGRVGIEPTSRGLRNRCKGQHLLPTQELPTTESIESSHPLESNQDLSVFSQARRPHAPGWVIRVPAPCGHPRRSTLRFSGFAPSKADLRRGCAVSAAQQYWALDSNQDLNGSEPSVVPSWTSPVCQSQLPIWWGVLESNQASRSDGSTIRPVSIAVYRPGSVSFAM